jgi:coproporphyrinogen III oxidase-like Fe-S oxidoreductase
MCENETVLDHPLLDPAFIESAFDKLVLLEADELVKLSGRKIRVTEKGMSFIRIISAAIDAYLWRNHSGANTFSKAI